MENKYLSSLSLLAKYKRDFQILVSSYGRKTYCHFRQGSNTDSKSGKCENKLSFPISYRIFGTDVF